MHVSLCLSVCVPMCMSMCGICTLVKGMCVPRCTRRTDRGHWVSRSVTLCLVPLSRVDSLNLELDWHTAYSKPQWTSSSSPRSAGVTGVQTATPSFNKGTGDPNSVTCLSQVLLPTDGITISAPLIVSFVWPYWSGLLHINLPFLTGYLRTAVSRQKPTGSGWPLTERNCLWVKCFSCASPLNCSPVTREMEAGRIWGTQKMSSCPGVGDVMMMPWHKRKRVSDLPGCLSESEWLPS